MSEDDDVDAPHRRNLMLLVYEQTLEHLLAITLVAAGTAAALLLLFLVLL
jgi:hypothetical protein